MRARTEGTSMTNYPAHLLCYGKGANTTFSSAPASLHPGSAFSCLDYSEQDILLAGGFPGIHPDSPFPLSPGLQLNGDLGTFNAAALHQIASVELSRHTGTRFRSYTLAPDPRVVVLADNPDKLFSFIDTYGGMLDLQPLLLEGYHPELSTAQQLTTECTEKECQIHYQVKAPILAERCTYCGACGTACPEDCLSEQLFLDFSRCSLCKKCIAVCENKALDLHAIEQRNISTPALLILENVDIDLQQVNERIYHEAELPRLFASIGEYLVDEAVYCNYSICQYLAAHNTGCTKCAETCPEQAISLTENGIQINQQSCTECGSCIATCPTGAMQYLRFSDQQFLDYWAQLDVSGTKTIVIGDEAQLHSFWWRNRSKRYSSTFFLEYPNPSALTAMHLLSLYGAGARRIILLSSDQDDISRAFMEQAKQSNQIVASFSGEEAFIQITQPDKLPSILTQTVEIQSIRQKVIKDQGNRRSTLAALLTTLLEEQLPSQAVLADETFNTFGTILCDEGRCTQCLACLSSCHIEALQANEEQFTLLSNPSHCVQCGSCIAICPENALSSRNGLELSDDFFQSRELSRAEPARCEKCGKIFGTRKSLDRVRLLLMEKSSQNFDPELLAYCDTCRVVRIFEGQQS